MINGLCFSHTEEGSKETWPTVFAGVPEVGTIVSSESGYEERVYSIVHRQVFLNPKGDSYTSKKAAESSMWRDPDFDRDVVNIRIEPRVEIYLRPPDTRQ